MHARLASVLNVAGGVKADTARSCVCVCVKADTVCGGVVMQANDASVANMHHDMGLVLKNQGKLDEALRAFGSICFFRWMC